MGDPGKPLKLQHRNGRARVKTNGRGTRPRVVSSYTLKEHQITTAQVAIGSSEYLLSEVLKQDSVYTAYAMVGMSHPSGQFIAFKVWGAAFGFSVSRRRAEQVADLLKGKLAEWLPKLGPAPEGTQQAEIVLQVAGMSDPVGSASGNRKLRLRRGSFGQQIVEKAVRAAFPDYGARVEVRLWADILGASALTEGDLALLKDPAKQLAFLTNHQNLDRLARYALQRQAQAFQRWGSHPKRGGVADAAKRTKVRALMRGFWVYGWSKPSRFLLVPEKPTTAAPHPAVVRAWLHEALRLPLAEWQKEEKNLKPAAYDQARALAQQLERTIFRHDPRALFRAERGIDPDSLSHKDAIIEKLTRDSTLFYYPNGAPKPVFDHFEDIRCRMFNDKVFLAEIVVPWFLDKEPKLDGRGKLLSRASHVNSAYSYYSCPVPIWTPERWRIEGPKWAIRVTLSLLNDLRGGVECVGNQIFSASGSMANLWLARHMGWMGLDCPDFPEFAKVSVAHRRDSQRSVYRHVFRDASWFARYMGIAN